MESMTTLQSGPASKANYDRDGVIQVNGLFSAGETGTIRAAFMEQVVRDHAALGAHDNLAAGDILSRYPGSCSRTGARTSKPAASPGDS